jgi:guanylate kinase
MRSRRGELRPVVLAAPSGAGKTTIARRLARERDFIFSVSATTRPPRPGEVQGQDYRFVTLEEFRSMIEGGELAEWAEVHGRFYGTPMESLRSGEEKGARVLLDIDVQGALQIRETVPRALLLFILPPSVDALLQRLQGRGTEGEEEIRRRFTTALQELRAADAFDYFVINDDLERAVREVRTLARTGKPPAGGTSGSVADVEKLEKEVEAFLEEGFAPDRAPPD